MRHRVEALLPGHRLQVVDHQRDRFVHGADGGQEQRRDRHGRMGRRQRPEHTRIDGLDAVEGGGEVGEQHHGVVVPVIR
jgi:hypothetical protein